MNSKQYSKDWYSRNREARVEYSKRYREEHKEEIKEYVERNKEKKKKYDQERYDSKRASYLFNGAKHRAKQTPLEFSIEKDDISIPEICPYLGIPITYSVGLGKIDANPSIDRIDNSKGYIKGNVQVISFLANRMKNNASEKDLIAFAKGVLKVHAGIDIDKTLALLGELQQIPELHKDSEG